MGLGWCRWCGNFRLCEGNKNAYKHGRYMNEAIQERRTLRALLKAFRNNLATV
jgi:hypothetical protein